MSRENLQIRQIIPAIGWFVVFEPDKNNPTPVKLPIACWGLKDCHDGFGSEIVPMVCYVGDGYLTEVEEKVGYDLVYLPNDDGRLAVPTFATRKARTAEVA